MKDKRTGMGQQILRAIGEHVKDAWEMGRPARREIWRNAARNLARDLFPQGSGPSGEEREKVAQWIRDIARELQAGFGGEGAVEVAEDNQGQPVLYVTCGS